MKLLVTTLISAIAATSAFAGVINLDCGNGGVTATEKGRVGDGTTWNTVSTDTNNLVDQYGNATPVDIDFVTAVSNWTGPLGNELQNSFIDSYGAGNTISGYIRQLRPNTRYQIVIYHSHTSNSQAVYLGPTAPFFTPFVAPATPGPLPGELYKDYLILSSTTDGSGNLKFTLHNSGGLAVLAGMQIQGWLPGEGRGKAYQSDLSISNRSTGGFKGEGIFAHRPSAEQTKTVRSKRRKRVTQYVNITNGGDAYGAHEVDGDATDRKVRRVYRDQANANITSEIITATYQVTLYPEGTVRIRVDAKPKRRAGKKENTNIFAVPVDHDVNAATDVVTSKLRQTR